MGFRVEFTAAARADVGREIREHWDGREIGGALVGKIDGNRIVVAHGGGLGVGVETARGERHVRLRAAHLFDFAVGCGLDLVGEWHTHPGGGTTRPSKADLDYWQKTGAALGVSAYVGVILAPDKTVVPGLTPGQDQECWSFEAPSAWARGSTYVVTANDCHCVTSTVIGDRHAHVA